MKISGIQKTTLIDYPGEIAATVFTYGCNFRCPFCHNPELVVEPYNEDHVITEQYVLDFLKLRHGKLDALAITGGEPLLQDDIQNFIQRVKELGYLIKVDTNGFSPDMILKLTRSGLVDYWAMDIKNSEPLYSKTAGVSVNIENIRKSIANIMNSGVKYEFRTTVVPGFHDEKSMQGIGELIKGADKFYIQNFRSRKTLDPKLSGKPGFGEKDLLKFKQVIESYVKNVVVRGL